MSTVAGPDVNNQLLWASVAPNSSSTVHELATELNLTYTTIYNRLKQTRKTKKLDKCVSHQINKNIKPRRYKVSSNLPLHIMNNLFLN